MIGMGGRGWHGVVLSMYTLDGALGSSQMRVLVQYLQEWAWAVGIHRWLGGVGMKKHPAGAGCVVCFMK